MITKLSTKTNNHTLNELVSIHKRCVLRSNSTKYNEKQIEEWLSLVNTDNIKNQLENTSWVVLEEKENIVGFIQYSMQDKEIYQIQVEPTKQRCGYGKKMYNFVEEEFKRGMVDSISLFATLNSFGFYEKLGFKIIKTIQFPLVSTKIDMIEMKKVLLY